MEEKCINLADIVKLNKNDYPAVALAPIVESTEELVNLIHSKVPPSMYKYDNDIGYRHIITGSYLYIKNAHINGEFIKQFLPQTRDIVKIFKFDHCVFEGCTFDFSAREKDISKYRPYFLYCDMCEMHNCSLKMFDVTDELESKPIGEWKDDFLIVHSNTSVWYNCSFTNINYNYNRLSKLVLGTLIGNAKFYHSILINTKSSIEENVINTYDLSSALHDENFPQGVKEIPSTIEFDDDCVVFNNNQCPKEGSFTAYKVVSIKFGEDKKVLFFPAILKLTVPETAKRSSAFGYKCRVSEAIVEDVVVPDRQKTEKQYPGFIEKCMKYLEVIYNEGKEYDFFTREFYNNPDFEFVSPLRIRYRGDDLQPSYITYKLGSKVEVQDFDERYYIECSNGIHCFTNFEAAVAYSIFIKRILLSLSAYKNLDLDSSLIMYKSRICY